MEYDFNILYYINMYKKWWKTIAKLMIIAMFFTSLFLLRIPPNYVSTVTLISFENSSLESSSLGRFLGISNFSSSTSSKDIIIAILGSNRMARDIRILLEAYKNPNFNYSITTRNITGGFAIDVRGRDPALTEKIANFVVQNLDKINSELNITPNKPMVKVLDAAGRGGQGSREIPRKMLITAIFSFLIASSYIFFLEYLQKLKAKDYPNKSSGN